MIFNFRQIADTEPETLNAQLEASLGESMTRVSGVEGQALVEIPGLDSKRVEPVSKNLDSTLHSFCIDSLSIGNHNNRMLC